MSLRETLQQFLNDKEWEDEISHDDDDGTDFISTQYGIGEQRFTLVLITDDNAQTISVLMVSPIGIPKPRTKEAAVVVNGLNNRMAYGNLGIQDDGTVFFRWAMNVEGTTAASTQFSILVDVAASAFDALRSSAIGAAAFSKQSGDEILMDYNNAVNMNGENSDGAPTSL